MDSPHPNSSPQAIQPSLCRRLFACVLPRSAPFLRAGALGILIHGTAFAQTTYDWFDTAPDGNWKQGAAGARWTGGLWDEPPSGNILRFNNNHQLTMTNNVVGYSVHQLIFGALNTANRTIGGNALSMNDWSGADPKIENQSTGSHTITLNLTGDSNDPLELNPTSGDLTFNGTINNNGSAIFVYGDNAKALFLNGVVSGSGSLVVKQYSKVISTAAHTYSGNTYIDEGEFWIGQNATVSGTIDVGASAQVANVSKLFISDADGGTTAANNITVQTGNTDTRFIGTLNTSGTNTYSGNITLNSGVVLETASGGTMNTTGVISGTGAVYNKNTGRLLLSGNNTFSGGSFLSANSTTLLGHDKGLGTGTIELSFGASTTQTLASSDATARALTNNLNIYNNAVVFGQASGGTGNLTISGTVALGSDGSPVTRTLTVNNTTTTLSGIVSGGANNALTKAGTGTLVLSGANTYAGTTTISAGTLTLSSGSAIADTGAVVMANATSTVLSVNTSETIGNLSGGGTLGGNIAIASGQTLTVNQTSSLNYNGTISGDGGLTINGTSQLTLRGNNTFTGMTTITSGSLRLENAALNSQAIVGNITVSGGNLLFGLNSQIADTSSITMTSGNIDLSTRAETIDSITMSGGTLRRAGGALTLNSASSFTGGTANFTAATSGITTLGSTTLGNATFEYSTTGSATAGLVLGGGIEVNANATANFTNSGGGLGRIDLNGANRTIDVGTGATMNVGWTIAGTSVGITKNGSGTLALTAANTYTGPTTISAGTLQIGAGSTTGSLSTSSAITNNGALVFNRSNAITQGTDFSGAAITGTGMVIKQGSSDATLNNSTNSFSGGVWVQNGTLYANSFGNSGAASFLGTNGTIKLGSSSTVAGLRFSNGAPVETTDKVIDLAGTTGGGTITAGNATITMTSNLAMSGAGSKTLSFNSSGNTNTFNLTFDGLLADVNGVLSVGFGGSGNGNFLLGNSNNSFSGPVTINANTASTTTTLSVASFGMTGSNSHLGKNGTIFIGSSSSTATNILKYTGTGETSDKNINLSGGETGGVRIEQSGASGQLVLTGNITNTGSGTKALTLQGSTAGTALLSGTIANSSGGNATNVTKAGTGTWILSGANTYSGNTTISAGTLAGANANAFGSGSISVSGSGTLSLRGDASTSFVKASDSAAYTIQTSATGATINVDQATGAGTTSKTMTIGSIGTSSTAGTYQVNFTGSNNTSLSLGAVTGPVSTAGSPTVTLSNSISGGGGLTLASYTSAATGGPETLAFSGNGNTTVTGAISPSSTVLSLTKSGVGTLTLAGNNAYTGATAISAGVLNIQHANALGTTAGSTTVTSGAALELQGGITVGAEALSLSGTGLSATGALRNIFGDNTYGGAITLAAHSTIGSDAGTLTLSGDITGTKDLTIVGAGNTSIVGNITTSTSALTKNGTGTLFLSGTNSTYSGVTTINDGVVNVAYLTNALVNGPLGAANDNATKLMLAGGTLQYTGNNATSTDRNFTLLGNFTIDASGSASNATMSFAATGSNHKFSQAASATLTLTGSNTGSNVISGVITDNSSGNLTSLVKSGVGTWVLDGSNTYNGTTTINAGTLQIGPTGRLGAGSYAGNISNNATLIYSGTNAQTLSGIISGTGALTQNNSSSTLTLTGANTYTGTTTINAGTLQLGNNGATGSLSADSAITVDGALVFRRSDAISQGTNFSTAAITGTGVVIHNSANSTTLTNNANSFSGGVWVQQGTLFAGAIGNSGEASFLGSCGTIKLGSSSSTGTLRLTTGSPIETTDKVIDLSGTTGGGSIIAANATITMTGNLAMSGTGNKTLFFTSSGSSNTFNLTYSGLIAEGAGSVLSLTFAGSGNGNHTLTNASNSFSGAVSIAGNTSGTTTTLNVAGIGNTGAASYLGKNSTINIGASSSGTNILKYTGTGETTDKVINLASTSNSNQASLDASNASGLLKFTSDFTATGTASSKVLNLIGTGNAEIAGAIVNNTSGNVTNVTNVTKSGAGTWTLSGNNTYTGTTTISGGTLVISGTNSGSAITVSSGGTLAGTGTGGDTTVNSGGKISPGNSPGILTVGGLTLNGNGTYTWEMADATGAAGTGWDQINATGLLTIGSNATSTFKIAITSSGAPTNWDYTTTNQTWDIINYGSISGFNASYFTLNSTAFGGDLTPDSSWSLVDTGSALRLTYAYTQNTPTYTGSTGNWSTGFSPAITNSANAIFVGAGGTATNDIASGTLSSIGTLTFDGSNSYTLEAASGSAGYNSASALAIGGTIANNSLAVQTINLATSFAANQTINANTGGLVIGGNVSIGTGAILSVVGSNNTTISGVVSGLGGLTKNSSSTLTLSGNNSYAGNTIIAQGKVLIGDNNAFGTGSMKLGISGVNATITLASTDGTARTISNALDGWVGSNWNTTFGEASGGTGNLTFTNTGSVALGSATRTLNILNTTTFAASFSGSSGIITKTGAGTLIFAGASTYGGVTTINAGTLQLGNGLSTGSLNATSSITNNGTLVFSRNNTQTQGTAFGTVISGSGNVIQNGTGTLVLNGVNTYTGSTTVSTGNLTISNASALGGTAAGTTVASGAALQIQGDIAVGAEALNLTGSGFSNAGALRNISGANSLAGAITLSGATTIGSDAGTLTLSGGISGTQNLTLVGAGNITLSGGIATSTGTLTKNGSGTATLSAANTYSGSTTINSGTLVAAAANALGSTSQIVVTTGGSLLVTADDSVNNSAGVTLAGGSLAFSGNRNETFGALTLSANSTLDFGTESVIAVFSSLLMNGHALDIYNWTGTTLWNGGTGNNTDQFYISSAIGASDLSRISFYSSTLQNSFLGDGYQIMSGGFANQIIPVPEPETYAAAVILLLGLGIHAYRTNRRRTEQKQAQS